MRPVLFFFDPVIDSFSKHRTPQDVMNALPRFSRLVGLAALWFVLAVSAHAQYATQTLVLSNGWNGVFLEVAPDDPSCDAVFSNWPVANVSAYVVDSLRPDYTDDTGTNQIAITEFLTWLPGSRPERTASTRSWPAMPIWFMRPKRSNA